MRAYRPGQNSTSTSLSECLGVVMVSSMPDVVKPAMMATPKSETAALHNVEYSNPNQELRQTRCAVLSTDALCVTR